MKKAIQFVKEGVKIPSELVRAHAEGRVVFVAGAGVSMGAGLPCFKKLVVAIRKAMVPMNQNGGIKFPKEQQEAFAVGDYENVLTFVETEWSRDPQRPLMGRGKVLNEMCKQLGIDKCRNNGTDSDVKVHKALLDLSWSDIHGYHLVTTNFDRLFTRAASFFKGEKPKEHIYPNLPDPAKEWNGVAYMHGQIPESGHIAEDQYRNYVLTSADFGRAYADEYERYAGRFIQSLFRNYIIVFVGYSLGDRFVRNIVDSLHYDQKEKNAASPRNQSPRFYAFTNNKKGWKSRGCEPILYENHGQLNKTLVAWANLHINPANIKLDLRYSSPQSGNPKTDTLMWGIVRKNDKVLNEFINLTPTVDISWFWHITADEWTTSLIMGEYGDSADETLDKKAWDRKSGKIARWVIKNHGHNPEFAKWFFDNYYRLNPHFREAADLELLWLHKSPIKNPRQPHHYVWDMYHAGRIRLNGLSAIREKSPSVYYLPTVPDNGGINLSHEIRARIEKCILPIIHLKNASATTSSDDPDTWNMEVTLNAGDDLHTLYKCLHSMITRNQKHHYEVVKMVQTALESAVEIRESEFLTRNNRDAELDYLFYIPSIAPHQRNCRSQGQWIQLVFLLRDAWEQLHGVDPTLAAKIAECWMHSNHTLFIRLALHAAGQGAVLPALWHQWLTRNQGAILQKSAFRPELHVLIQKQANKLNQTQRNSLVDCILSKHPTWNQEAWTDEITRNIRPIWAIMSAMQQSTAPIGRTGQTFMQTAKKNCPNWKYEESNRFSYFIEWRWASPTTEEILGIPEDKEGIFNWLSASANKIFPSGADAYDIWSKRVKENPTLFAHALMDYLLEVKPAAKDLLEIINTTFYELSDDSIDTDKWKDDEAMMGKIIQSQLPIANVHGITRWLQSTAKRGLSDKGGKHLVQICKSIVATSTPANGEGMSDAINSNIGHVVLALTEHLRQREIRHGKRNIPTDIANILKKLLASNGNRFEHTVDILLSHLNLILWLDSKWAHTHLEPLLSWDNPSVAKLAWESMLFAGRYSWQMVVRHKHNLRDSIRHYSQFNEDTKERLAFLIFLIIIDNQNESEITPEDCRDFIASATPDFIPHLFHVTKEWLGGKNKDDTTNFSEKVMAFIRDYIKPQKESAIAELESNNPERHAHFVGTMIDIIVSMGKESKENFAPAVDLFEDWLRPHSRFGPHYEICKHSSLCSDCPDAMLKLMKIIVPGDGAMHYPERNSAKECLEQIAATKPELKNTREFRRLNRILDTP